MERVAIEQRLKSLVDARLEGSLEGCLEHFSEKAEFQLAGSPEASQVVGKVSGRGELRELLAMLFATWRWERVDFLKVITDGDEAAVRYELKATFVPTGTAIETEIMDHFVFDAEGRIVSVTQFVDTALAQKLMEQAQRGAGEAAF